MDAIKQLVALYGSQEKTAEALGVSQPTIHAWLTGKHGVSMRRARDIERRTQGKVKATELLGL